MRGACILSRIVLVSICLQGEGGKRNDRPNAESRHEDVYKRQGWKVWPLLYGIAAIICAIGTCLLGFWISTVRLLCAMGRQNFLPAVFSKCNRFGQPILPNIFLLIISFAFLLMQNTGTFMKDFFNLMAFGCAVTYAITMIGAMRLRKIHPEWVSPYKLPGGQFTRVLALILCIAIAFATTIGQGVGS